jgi:hypothetical protein
MYKFDAAIIKQIVFVMEVKMKSKIYKTVNNQSTVGMNKLLSFLIIILFTGVLANSAIATTFTVTNTNNAGAGSLRQAILDANASPGADSITLTFPVFIVWALIAQYHRAMWIKSAPFR